MLRNRPTWPEDILGHYQVFAPSKTLLSFTVSFPKNMKLWAFSYQFCVFRKLNRTETGKTKESGTLQLQRRRNEITYLQVDLNLMDTLVLHCVAMQKIGYTLLQKKRNFSEPIFTGDPWSLTLTPGHVHFVKWF